MLVLRALVQSGELPLLGPPTSIGDFHHGVLYYYLLAPAAALTWRGSARCRRDDRASQASPPWR